MQLFAGENFIAVVTSDVMTAMAETARDLLMTHTMAQWLYVISDTNSSNGNLSNLINDLYEGENVAYIYNMTDNSPDCKVRVFLNLLWFCWYYGRISTFMQSIPINCRDFEYNTAYLDVWVYPRNAKRMLHFKID